MNAPAPPKSLGKYHLIAELGHGGMADVYLAAVRGPAGFSKLQVVKQLRPALAGNAEVVAMFLDEARLAARLNHPNVVQTFEVEQIEEGNCSIAMEYLDGQPFDRILRRTKKQGALPLPMALRVLCDTLAGLHHAHDLRDYDGTPLRVVHRDVSPQNIFVTYEGQIKVVDFGIAKAANGSTETRTGVLKGKLAYMAPEQAVQGTIDARADLFAVGVLLVEAITGQKFWGQATDIQVLHKLSRGDVPAIPADASIPGPLRLAASRALARSPADRYPDALAFQADLEAYLQSIGGCSARDVGVFVAQLFADRRTQARAVIDEQLRLLRASPSVPPPRSNLANQTMQITAARPDASAVRQTAFAASASPTTDPGSSVPPGPSPSRWPLVGIALAAALVSGLALRALTTPPSVAPAAAPSSAPAPESIELRLSASPPSARIFVDDMLVPNNPFVGRFPRDGNSHRLRIEAPGHQPQAQIVPFDTAARIVTVALQPTTAAAPSSIAATPATERRPADHRAPAAHTAAPPATSAAPPATAAEPTPPVPPPTSTNRRPIDGDDPWK